MGNGLSRWAVIVLMTIGIVSAVVLGIYAYNKGKVSDNTNIVDIKQLAENTVIENSTNMQTLNEVVTTSSNNLKISPNASVIEKRYYKSCDHLIREVKDIPKDLVNGSEKDVENYYAGWKIEKCSEKEIVIYKEFKNMCEEHYIIKEHNGVLGIYTKNEEGIQEWQEDTEIEVQYLPEKDIEEFKIGIEVVGKAELYNFLEDYE